MLEMFNVQLEEARGTFLEVLKRTKQREGQYSDHRPYFRAHSIAGFILVINEILQVSRHHCDCSSEAFSSD